MSVGILGGGLVACQVVCSGMAVPAASGPTAIAWDVIELDRGGFFPGGAPASPIIPAGGAGWYLVVQTVVANTAAAVPAEALWWVGPSFGSGPSVVPTTTPIPGVVVSVATLVWYNDGDVVALDVENNDGVNACAAQYWLELRRITRRP